MIRPLKNESRSWLYSLREAEAKAHGAYPLNEDGCAACRLQAIKTIVLRGSKDYSALGKGRAYHREWAEKVATHNHVNGQCHAGDWMPESFEVGAEL